jgi:hypothetical protein
MSVEVKNYNLVKDTITFNNFNIESKEILLAITSTNNYLNYIINSFEEIGLNFLESLGQRNLSAVIGEIYKQFFSKQITEFLLNPHPDGRPDLIFVKDKFQKEYYDLSFEETSHKKLPIKKRFTPFPYGGIEIKCSIGTHAVPVKMKKNYKPNEPRINFLRDVGFMSHHIHELDLLGLYYDYYEEANGNPQILMAFYTKIEISDWSQMSLGTDSSKTTSATSLSQQGRLKLKQNTLLHINNEKYVEKFSNIGFNTVDL